jgi:rare lipoprotein A
MKRLPFDVAASALLLACCTRTPAPFQVGIASWYGPGFQGRLCANGEIFDTDKLTAAHRTLPFGSVLLVLHQANHKVVQVRVNDRGPFVSGRIIDLSHAAAQTIEMPGVAPVELKVLSKPVTRGPDLYGVQIGMLDSLEAANHMRDALQERYGAARVVLRDGEPQLWRVVVGQEDTAERAEELAQKLRPEYPDVFVVHLDPAP